MVINEYLDNQECKKEYSNFVEDILKQIINNVPDIESRLNLTDMPYKRTEDLLISDLSDRIFDSVAPYYEKYREYVFCEILAEKLANKNYPIIESNPIIDCDENILAKHLYFKLLLLENNLDFANISAAKIDGQLERAKRNCYKAKSTDE